MSVLARVREKFKAPMSGTSGSSKSSSARSAGLLDRDSEKQGTPSAGSAGASSTYFGKSLSPVQETARADVLLQLERNPSVQRAFVNRFERDGTLIVTLAIRGVGTGELKISAVRFNHASSDDYAAVLGCIGGVA